MPVDLALTLLLIAVIVMGVQLVLCTVAICQLTREVRALTKEKRQHRESGCWRLKVPR